MMRDFNAVSSMGDWTPAETKPVNTPNYVQELASYYNKQETLGVVQKDCQVASDSAHDYIKAIDDSNDEAIIKREYFLESVANVMNAIDVCLEAIAEDSKDKDYILARVGVERIRRLYNWYNCINNKD